jgi:hypothetical protein
MPDRAELLAELESAKTELTRCMGGVDQAGAVRISRRITELRNALRDNPAMIEHLERAVREPVVPRRKRG